MALRTPLACFFVLLHFENMTVMQMWADDLPLLANIFLHRSGKIWKDFCYHTVYRGV